MSSPVVERFSPATREWFTGTFGAPTPAQEGAWEAISRGDHTLVVAPTGSGKTLSAFLWALDRLSSTPRPDDVDRRCRVLYVSPMKALAVDVERNLRSPLVGIKHASARLNLAEPAVDVAVRSGDTTPAERRAFASKSSDVLITTPESLFLLLTSNARERLRGVEYVIVDEIHAVAGTKRGSHLAVTLDRLDALLQQPAQRIGLSATVSPVSEVERFLAGGRPVTTVQPPSAKTWELDVVVPVEDMADLATTPRPDADTSFDDHAPETSASIWPHVEERIVDLVAAHTSTLIFANSRRLAERLTARLNEIWSERLEAAENHAREEVDEENADDTVDTRADSGQFMRDYDARASKPAAQLIGGAGTTRGVPAVLARAHHGSVSKDVRADIETELKAGRLPAVVATSSLELGIDMGAIDLVVQVESPPSVASGLQRIGRAGHQAGATSHGVLFPKYRGDLLSAAVVVERMRAGEIEPIHPPSNPLDVLAQQIVAMVAMDDWPRESLLTVLQRSAPFAALTPSVLDSVLDMLSGLYPSDSFRELRARIVWDRTDDVLRARPGAQRLAVISGGTIPDRGLYGVFLAGGDGPGRRVGELDEEMVYESRVGDVFTLGTSTWRIEDITRDQVLVTPAPGQAARLPFWKGDSLGRPLELGRAIGAFSRELGDLSDADATSRARAVGLDELAAKNLVTYLREQQEATGRLPSDRTVVVERFRDEMGDWRIVVHSPFGAAIHAPWALVVSARMRERFGAGVQAMHTDDGLVFRLLDTDGDDDALTAALLEAIVLDPDEITARVTDEVGATPLFASRFRECAARALLLPRQNPGRRQALWQQRQRAAQLLEVASDYPSFPIVLEAVREVLQDVYDVPGLVEIMRSIERRDVQVVHTETTTPSPYAKGMLFSYVAQFLYEGDSPLAERRAAALSLDPDLLADLLGSAGGLSLADLLDPNVVRTYERRLQLLDPSRRMRHGEDLADALRTLGPLTLDEIVARAGRHEAPEPDDESAADGTSSGDGADVEPPSAATSNECRSWWKQLVSQRRAIEVRWGGKTRLAAIEDAARLRDALGVALPPGVAQAFLEPHDAPLDDLLTRYAACHGPFTARQAATAFGLGVAIVSSALTRLTQTGRLTHGDLLPDALGGGEGGGEFCDNGVLRSLRRLSLASLRAEIEPVPAVQYARFLPRWQQVGDTLRGADGVLAALEPLVGVPMPASAIESLILPARVRRYRPADLDELLASGELLWQGHGSISADDGWISFHTPDSAPLTLRANSGHHRPSSAEAGADAANSDTIDDSNDMDNTSNLDNAATPDAQTSDSAPTWQRVTPAAIRDVLAGGGSHLFRDIAAAVHSHDDTAVVGALWHLVWDGVASGDTFAPVRALLGGGAGAHKARVPSNPGSRYARLRGPALGSRPRAASSGLSTSRGPAHGAGRWRLLPTAETDLTERTFTAAELLLARHGVVTRGAVVDEEVPGGFSAVYRVLAGAEERGLVRRGYFVEGLGASQFGAAVAVDSLRATRSAPADPWGRYEPEVLVLAACDPANPYGAALPWPAAQDAHAGHRPGRKAGALVVLADGELVTYLERGGRTALTWPAVAGVWPPIAAALADLVTKGSLASLTVRTVNGVSALGNDDALVPALLDAGFHASPQGIRKRR